MDSINLHNKHSENYFFLDVYNLQPLVPGLGGKFFGFSLMAGFFGTTGLLDTCFSGAFGSIFRSLSRSSSMLSIIRHESFISLIYQFVECRCTLYLSGLTIQ